VLHCIGIRIHGSKTKVENPGTAAISACVLHRQLPRADNLNGGRSGRVKPYDHIHKLDLGACLSVQTRGFDLNEPGTKRFRVMKRSES